MHITRLPTEIIQQVLYYVQPRDRIRYTRLSRRFYHLLTDYYYVDLSFTAWLHLSSRTSNSDSASILPWFRLPAVYQIVVAARVLSVTESLWCGHTSAQCVIPRAIGLLSGTLQTIDFFDCHLVGKLPRELGALIRLTRLNLASNGLYGEIPREIGMLVSLECLNLGVNRLDGCLPEEIWNLTCLRTFSVACNNLRGHVSSNVGKLIYLRTFVLSGNRFSGPLPQAIGSLRHLEVLDCSSNCFSGPISTFEPNFRLRSLNLSNNALSGDIPNSLSNLPLLQSLYLNANCLSGEIPTSLGLLDLLKVLHLQDNCLKGPIPSALFLTRSFLESVILDRNQLSGSIPWEVRHCRYLCEFSACDNTLSGLIPAGLFFLPYIERVMLRGNHLCGIIPGLNMAAPWREMHLSEPTRSPSTVFKGTTIAVDQGEPVGKSRCGLMESRDCGCGWLG